MWVYVYAISAILVAFQLATHRVPSDLVRGWAAIMLVSAAITAGIIAQAASRPPKAPEVRECITLKSGATFCRTGDTTTTTIGG